MRKRVLLVAAAAWSIAGAAQAGTQRVKAESPEAAAGKRDAMVCKRFATTGSLVGRYRACKTRWEWERERENLRVLSVADSCRNRGDPTAGGGGCPE